MKSSIVCFFFAIAFLSASAMVVPRGTCTGDRDALMGCFENVIDTDHDGKITLIELNNTITTHKDKFPNKSEAFLNRFTPAKIMQACDKDGNGYLDINDWNHADACLRRKSSIDYVCRLCYLVQNM
jgi:Ca2+-binding EF-hand superfamily protein